MGSQSDRVKNELIDWNDLINIPPIWINRSIGGYFTQGVSLSTSVLVADRLYAIPFVVNKKSGEIFDAMSMEVTSTGGVGKLARMGIYENSSDSFNYPTILMVDSGEFDVELVAIKEVIISAKHLNTGIYWLALLSNGTPTIRMMSNNLSIELLGFLPTLGASVVRGWRVSQVYNELPTKFTSGGTKDTTGIGVWLRKSG